MAFVGFEITSYPFFLGLATWDLFYTILFFVSSTGGCFCTLILVFFSLGRFFNIFPLILFAPTSYSTKFILLNVVFEIIAMSSSKSNFRPRR